MNSKLELVPDEAGRELYVPSVWPGIALALIGGGV